MADSTLPKITRWTAVTGWLTIVKLAALLAGLACSPLALADQGNPVVEYSQSGETRSPPCGDATGSVDMAADIARSAANGALNYPVDPHQSPLSRALTESSSDKVLMADINN